MSFITKIKKNKKLNEILEVTPSVNFDERGEIFTLFDRLLSKKILPKNRTFNHFKITKRKKNCLVGIHFDFKTWKLFGCINGKIFHTVSCFKKKNKNYLKSSNYILSDKKIKFILIPPGYGNSFYCLQDSTILYALSYQGSYNDFNSQKTIAWNDKSLSINWPCKKPYISLRDKNGVYLR
jgi:dTDP-4-dehydrorhamnose 3,5-epimerase